ncbi:DUF308 domain-containing protein [Oribacterium sp. WCC10]|uniref:DUF308 domain-containing protein n=1 Tax=Oribacterium sp. WCC10 TaxID=1855343 RepID=UPI0008E4B978|nr:DUF308 domain-containing protein [Oribacterium sp. WCC10]SFG45770.1 Uncharacterized membrane protein HdeD, DUF308 family [Oribacterium sp. WCC10]
MTQFQRVKSILYGILLISIAILIMSFPAESYTFILALIGTGFFLSGVSTLVYYFTMSRFMVGGKRSLYTGAIMIDFALLTLSFNDVPRVYVLLYFAVLHAFTGLIEILRANETRRNGSKHFKLKLSHGIMDVMLALICIIFIKDTIIAVFIYGFGLVYSGIMHFISAFRRTTMLQYIP